jgi:tRNA-2-methylthio-N6-dimethylallyladenosine synthase
VPGFPTDGQAAHRFAIENCNITADVIVGFPGETDADFEQTVDIARKASFSKFYLQLLKKGALKYPW